MKISPDRSNLFILLKQELKEVIYSKLLWLVSFVYIAFLIVFILVGSRESTVIGFTGINRLLFSWSHALTFFLPLLSLTTSITAITQYRENGNLEFFLSQPISRSQFFLALTMSRVLLLLLPLIVILIIASAVGGFSESNYQFKYGVVFFLIGSSLLWCFLSIGFYISEKSRSQVRSLVLMILAWITAVTFIDILLIGLILRFSPHSAFLFFLTELNPVQAARLTLLMELDTTLSTLGPVGFFVANHLGATPIFFIGFLWPLALGTFFWFITKNNFSRKDLI